MFDLFSWLRPKSQPPKPPHVTCSAIGVTMRRGDAETVDQQWTQQIFKQMAKSKFFEIRYHDQT
jgi:hypothetical protein